ncbi:MAG: EAL domain-containing protein [Xanthobacteraceae bacterium]|nr:EAL domain-containing protein [Xanthobacteraceae bacterium]
MPFSSSPTFDARTFKMLVASLYASPGSLIPGVVAGIVNAILCWLATEQNVFLYMAIVIVCILCMRVCTIVKYKSEDHTDDTFEQTAAWCREYMIGGTAFSFSVGMTALLTLLDSQSLPAHISSVTVVIALSSGYVARNSARPYGVALQLLTFCVPMAYGLFSVPDTYYNLLGWFTLLFLFTNIMVIGSIYRNHLLLINETKKSESLADHLHEVNVMLTAAMDNMHHGLAMFTDDLRLATVNARHHQLFPNVNASLGTPVSKLVMDMVSLKLLDRSKAELMPACLKEALGTQATASREILTKSGQTYLIHAQPVPSGGVVMVTEDITASKAAKAEIERLAHYDDLTGVPNRFHFNKALSRLCLAVQNGKNPGFSVVYMDLDGFKQINDSLGHDVGDELLNRVAHRLILIAEKDDFVARLGGDEFVYIHHKPDAASANLIAEKIWQAVTNPLYVRDKLLNVGVSMGIATAPEHGSSPKDLLRHADMALYFAKAKGRNTWVLFNAEVAREKEDRIELEGDLRQALAANKLEMFYQPIIDMETTVIASREALMRWYHPTRGFVQPSVFIQIAEESGLIDELGAFALNQACSHAVNWPTNETVAVNVSSAQFRNAPKLLQCVRDALGRSGLPANRLEIEITESLLIENQTGTLEVIRELRGMGIRISLDDFGTGYSSLSYLNQYPFSKVKIDRSFINDIHSDKKSRSIVQAIVHMAHSLNMIVVVEGVETEEQFQFLLRIGADLAQGWLFGRPAPNKTVPLLTKPTPDIRWAKKKVS